MTKHNRGFKFGHHKLAPTNWMNQIGGENTQNLAQNEKNQNPKVVDGFSLGTMHFYFHSFLFLWLSFMISCC